MRIKLLHTGNPANESTICRYWLATGSSSKSAKSPFSQVMHVYSLPRRRRRRRSDFIVRHTIGPVITKAILCLVGWSFNHSMEEAATETEPKTNRRIHCPTARNRNLARISLSLWPCGSSGVRANIRGRRWWW